MTSRPVTLATRIAAAVIVSVALLLAGVDYMPRFNDVGRSRVPYPAADSAFFARSIERASVASRPIRLMRWVANQADSVGPAPSGLSPRATLERAWEGGGVLCGDLARILKAALRAQGFRARHVQLNSSEGDSHVVVEVLARDGGWEVLDPTFNVTYENKDGPLGVTEIQEHIQQGLEVEPVFHGHVQYPSRMQHYPVHWADHFDRAEVYQRGPDWARLTPFRYWIGPRAHVSESG